MDTLIFSCILPNTSVCGIFPQLWRVQKSGVATLFLLFTDDCAFVSSGSWHVLQTAQDFGLPIGLKKTEALHQPPPAIAINDTALHALENFTFLSSTFSRNVCIDSEVANRMAKANSAFCIALLFKTMEEDRGQTFNQTLFTKLWSYLPCCMLVRHRPCVSDTGSRSTCSIWNGFWTLWVLWREQPWL